LVSEVSVHGRLAPLFLGCVKQNIMVKRVPWSRAAHLLEVRKQIREGLHWQLPLSSSFCSIQVQVYWMVQLTCRLGLPPLLSLGMPSHIARSCIANLPGFVTPTKINHYTYEDQGRCISPGKISGALRN
jgi:hypothetical protein